ncbi:GNAT family N-acetyltransferase [Bacillus swezeyi]|uniref:GNAT family N-acetyltransferase n=1 Tax=Bacillus swezeyi TaxID=1925020 RepID=A0A5M8RW84_9BACI|nr:GNAT family N-acetyltransferase [Bacillus swezeyi]KAA6451104.1 GNAT family N-acetyltransferase [Bacillus swezeyi]KAA6474766.1 GNAT family N-acetyltransferase [Bacillus swezeyi]
MRKLVRITAEADILRAISLSEYAFQRKLSEEELEKAKLHYQKHEVIGIIEDEKLLSKLNIIPFEVQIENCSMKMGGIAGVATWPEERRKGTVRQLLMASLNIMRENQQTICFLYPFKISFYRKFGWELTFYQKVISIKREQLTPLEQTEGFVRRLEKAKGADEAGMLYDQYRSRHNGLLKRGADYWMTNILEDSVIPAVYYAKNGVPLGYILYTIKDKKMTIEELICLRYEARAGLWNFVCQHDSMIEELEMTVDPQDGIDFLLDDPKIKQEIQPYMMARITDVYSFLEQYPLRRHIEEPFVFRVSDDIAEWNNLTLKVGRHGVEAADEESAANPLVIDIQSLTAFLLGARTARFLYEAGRLAGSEEEVSRLDSTIRPQTPWINDFF